jgi:hypothetical protein
MSTTHPLATRLGGLDDRIRAQREHAQGVWMELERERQALSAAPSTTPRPWSAPRQRRRSTTAPPVS